VNTIVTSYVLQQGQKRKIFSFRNRETYPDVFERYCVSWLGRVSQDGEICVHKGRLRREVFTMKTLTLEETVQWMERCISEGADWNEDFWSNYVDALNYLKEFQGLLNMWNDKLDKEQANQPLTWDELKTMEDKPVWIEYGSDEDTALKRWCLVQIVLDEYISLATTAIFFRAEKSKQGKTWQAYRKERE
jgi:hypothetical protein